MAGAIIGCKWLRYANSDSLCEYFFSYFSDMRLNLYSHNKKIFYPVRIHVNLPSTNHYCIKWVHNTNVTYG